MACRKCAIYFFLYRLFFFYRLFLTFPFQQKSTACLSTSDHMANARNRFEALSKQSCDLQQVMQFGTDICWEFPKILQKLLTKALQYLSSVTSGSGKMLLPSSQKRWVQFLPADHAAIHHWLSCKNFASLQISFSLSLTEVLWPYVPSFNLHCYFCRTNHAVLATWVPATINRLRN